MPSYTVTRFSKKFIYFKFVLDHVSTTKTLVTSSQKNGRRKK